MEYSDVSYFFHAEPASLQSLWIRLNLVSCKCTCVSFIDVFVLLPSSCLLQFY